MSGRTGSGFGTRLQEAVAARGPLLAGIDPHARLLEAWGLGDTPAGLRTFALRALAAVDGHVAGIKPQSAFFERHGSAGMAVLEELLGTARDRGILTVLDAKRGDIGSTMAGYAEAILRPGAPWEADALTLSPYLGVGALRPALDLALEHGKGAFVLALTSNPEGQGIQHARTADGDAVARCVTAEVAARCAGETAWGSVGVVIGATTGAAVRELGIDEELAAAPVPILSPGFGAQGAGPGDRARVFGAAASRVLVATSRALLDAGPEESALVARVRDLQTAYAIPASGAR